MISSNVSVFRFITGATSTFDPSVRNASVVLERDGEVLNQAAATDAMGDPLDAYRWLIAKARDVGYRVEPGMILLTGALGRVVEAAPGHYVARFDGLGVVEFSLE
ncbi:MAG: hypothetical protein HC809_05540 [Gammaproteobacteria bacterium]|nr:hypothetical protein [Gammaproteobacteria bacterium]